MNALKKKLIVVATQAMQGRKCDCNCHYGEEDAEKLVTAITPVLMETLTRDVEAAVKSTLTADLEG